MRLGPDNDNTYVDDRRGDAPAGGGGFGIPIGRGMGVGGTIILLILSLVFGRNFVGGGDGSAGAPANNYPSAGGPGNATGGEVAPVRETPEEHERFERARTVFNSTQREWSTLLPKQAGTQYEPARITFFREAVATGCGTAPAEVGPFYCPADQHVYIDLSFFDELAKRFGAPGDFAQAYVVAHEVGHHIQHLVGTDARVRQLQESRPQLANALSVRLELQADCYAGVWGAQIRDQGLLDPGDVQEGLAAASGVGDDRIQKQARGTVNPDSFTHGSSAQRSQWFQRGFQSGDMRSCDTFAGSI